MQALSRPTNATLGGISALAEFVVVYVADAVTTTTPGTTPVSLDKCSWWTVDVLKVDDNKKYSASSYRERLYR